MVACADVMAPVKTQLYVEDPAGPAIDFMVEQHMGLVPVVDRDHRFVGMISGDRLSHFLLPHSLMMMRGAKRMSYLNEGRDELRERIEAIRAKPLGDLVDREVKKVKAATPLSDALMMITEKQFVVPVVDDDDRLIGAISFFSVLHWLREGEG